LVGDILLVNELLFSSIWFLQHQLYTLLRIISNYNLLQSQI